MFIDFVGLLLANLMISYFLLAGYVYRGLDDHDQGKWAVGFGMCGLVATVFGGVMAVTWPIPGPYAVAYGEMSVLLGIVLLGAAAALAKGWSLTAVVWYGFFAGWGSVVIGVQIVHLKLTTYAIPSGIGFILSGLAGALAAPTWIYWRGNRSVRLVGTGVLVIAALIWAATLYPAYWGHMAMLRGWVPPLARMPMHAR